MENKIIFKKVYFKGDEFVLKIRIDNESSYIESNFIC